MESFEGNTPRSLNISTLIIFPRRFLKATMVSLSIETSFMYLPFPSVGVVWMKISLKDQLFQRLLQRPICCWRVSIWLPRQPATWKRFQLYSGNHPESPFSQDPGLLEVASEDVLDTMIDEVILGFCFDIHRLSSWWWRMEIDSLISDLLKLGPGRFHSWQEKRNHPCLSLAMLMWGNKTISSLIDLLEQKFCI